MTTLMLISDRPLTLKITSTHAAGCKFSLLNCSLILWILTTTTPPAHKHLHSKSVLIFNFLKKTPKHKYLTIYSGVWHLKPTGLKVHYKHSSFSSVLTKKFLTDKLPPVSANWSQTSPIRAPEFAGKKHKAEPTRRDFNVLKEFLTPPIRKVVQADRGHWKKGSKDTSQILCANHQTQRASAQGSLVDDSYKTVSENLWSTYSDGTLLIPPQAVLLKLTSFTLNILKQCLFFICTLFLKYLVHKNICFLKTSSISLLLHLPFTKSQTVPRYVLTDKYLSLNQQQKSHNRDRNSLLCSTFHWGENREGIFSLFFLEHLWVNSWSCGSCQTLQLWIPCGPPHSDHEHKSCHISLYRGRAFPTTVWTASLATQPL